MLVACAQSPRLEIEPDEQSTKADGLPTRLWLLDDHRIDVDEPSDLAFWEGRLYAVSDRHSKIYELDREGDVQDVIDIQGRDLEALAVDAEHFYVADESRARIWQLDDLGERLTSYDVEVHDNNSGIEGLTFDDAGHMLVAQEKNPARIIVLDLEGEELDRVKLEFADDLSALTWNPHDRHLYALSDEEHKLWRLDADFHKITSWKLPIDKPEGLAFDGTTLYVVSDSEERLYVFELD